MSAYRRDFAETNISLFWQKKWWISKGILEVFWREFGRKSEKLLKKGFMVYLRPVWLNDWVFVFELSGCGSNLVAVT